MIDRCSLIRPFRGVIERFPLGAPKRNMREHRQSDHDLAFSRYPEAIRLPTAARSELLLRSRQRSRFRLTDGLNPHFPDAHTMG
jgi:hypothetical protein